MSRVGKWLIVAVGILIVVGVGLTVFLWFSLGLANYVPSSIVDFRPTQFQAEADAKADATAKKG